MHTLPVIRPRVRRAARRSPPCQNPIRQHLIGVLAEFRRAIRSALFGARQPDGTVDQFAAPDIQPLDRHEQTRRAHLRIVDRFRQRVHHAVNDEICIQRRTHVAKVAALERGVHHLRQFSRIFRAARAVDETRIVDQVFAVQRLHHARKIFFLLHGRQQNPAPVARDVVVHQRIRRRDAIDLLERRRAGERAGHDCGTGPCAVRHQVARHLAALAGTFAAIQRQHHA